MKKLNLVLSALLCSACCALGLTACGEGNNGTPPPHSHEWSLEYHQDFENDQKHYQHCKTCDELKYSNHEFTNGVCICGAFEPPTGTQGLNYYILENGTGVTVGGIGNATDTDIVISPYYCGKPVTKISFSAFNRNDKITSVTIPATVTNIENNAFYGCWLLKKFTVDENNPVYSSQDGIIYNKDKTEFIIVPFALENAVTIPDGITEIPARAFDEGCEKLPSITLHENITAIGDYAFYSCESLTEIVIPDKVTTIGECAFQYCRGLKKVILPANCESIGKQAFDGLTDLTEIVIPESVAYVGQYTFSNCSGLTVYCEATEQPDGWNAEWNKVSYEEYYAPAVWNCKNNDVATDGFVYRYIDGIRYALKDNLATVVRQPKSIKEATIPASVSYNNKTYKVTEVGNMAFSNCHSLTKAVLPDSITAINDLSFGYCENLAEFTMPKELRTIGNDAFRECSLLPDLVFYDGLTTIGKNAFEGCKNIKTVIIPDTVTSVGLGAFFLTSIENATVPMAAVKALASTKNLIITNGTRIAKQTFWQRKIEVVTIPVSVTYIGEQAFAESSITDIYYKGTKTQWEAVTKEYLWDDGTGNYTVHCSDGDIVKS